LRTSRIVAVEQMETDAAHVSWATNRSCLSVYACLLVLLCTSQPANTQPVASTFARPTVKDSRMVARGQDQSAVRWLDNERIVFIGSKPGETRIEREREFPRNDLFVWNVATGKVSREAELSRTTGICVAPGYVRYHFERDGVPYVRFGVFGREDEAEVDVQAMKDGILAVSPISCREYNPKLLKRRYGDWALPLLERGEYLDRTSGHYAEPMRYFPSDGTEPVSLREIPTRNVLTTPQYSQYLDGYIFAEKRSRSGPEYAQRMWLLERSGKIRQAVVPAGPWTAGSMDAMPARGGWVMSSRARGLQGGFGAAGIYLITDVRVTRLMAGYPHALAVSPDGCKTAVSIETEPKKETARPRVWFIDMCV
jgi:hypothetical protein